MKDEEIVNKIKNLIIDYSTPNKKGGRTFKYKDMINFTEEVLKLFDYFAN